MSSKVSRKKANKIAVLPSAGGQGYAHNAAAVAVFVFSLSLYFVTLAPTVTLVDSGELILAAHSTGVAHPPGFPLYVMLAGLFSNIPYGNLAQRAGLFSALCAALASGVMTLLIFEVGKSIGTRSSTPDAAAEQGRISWPLLAIPAAFGGALLSVTRTLWSYATIAEVYALNSLLIITVFWLIFAWRNQYQEALAKGEMPNNQRLYLAASFFGMALGVHHVTVALMLPALAALVTSTAGFGFFRSRSLLKAAASALAGGLVYVYLPIAASRSPLINWGDPRTLERFWWHISGRQYQTFIDLSFARISEFGTLLLREYGIVWLPFSLVLMTAGLVYFYQRSRPLLIFVFLVIAADVLYCLSYEIAEDKDAYYLPAFITLIVTAAIGLRWCIEVTVPEGNRVAVSVGVIIALAAWAAVLVGNFPYNDRSRYFLASDYVNNIFKSVENRGMLLTSDWQVYSPSLYVREVERQRKDIIVININQLRRSWYFGYLNQSYPELVAASREKIDAYLEDLRAWEKDPARYQTSGPLSQRINSRFYEMIMSFIAVQSLSGPVYVTSDIGVNRSGQDAELTLAINSNYKLVPKGLVFGVVNKNGTNDLGEVSLFMRGITDRTLVLDDNDVAKIKVIPAYLSMAMNSGLYFAAIGDHQRAITHFKQALSIEPEFGPAKQGLAASEKTLANSTRSVPAGR